MESSILEGRQQRSTSQCHHVHTCIYELDSRKAGHSILRQTYIEYRENCVEWHKLNEEVTLNASYVPQILPPMKGLQTRFHRSPANFQIGCNQIDFTDRDIERCVLPKVGALLFYTVWLLR